MRPYWSRAETDRYGSTPVAASPARNRPPGPNFHITKSRRRAAWGLPPGSPRGPKRCSRCSWPLRRHAQAPDQFAQVFRKLLLDQFRVHGPQLPADFRLHVAADPRSEEHTSELQSLAYLVCRLLLEKKKRRST